MAADTYLEVLGRQECLALLRTAPVGWLAYPAGDRAGLVPVNFTVDDDGVVIRTGYGAKLAAAAHHQMMTFGAGSIDGAGRTGWSVLITGRARVVDDDDPAALLLAAPEPWAPGERDSLVVVPLTEVSGRRIGRG
ncbi:pyridoxamine 5'-phosphate oxidase family protein [Georgenia sp. TF02-10]|uniref:pyridoxamine 5'-phosphate oxidase family protein n=1 Tax=Georgenia sp. TF02-10 TaxID=2917725 RepID=UPI001FA76A23|nr:pyridoxamine 5'-phosphate oxidase family protein [Georgenia sp. TF02-10]UNX53864.1 pyridoxamine 5'-phosphate oxidase family protein [Georgenia sp. TF02-10]